MGDVHEIFSGKKLTEKDIEEINKKKNNVFPINKSELALDGLVIGSEEKAEEGVKSPEKSLEELSKKPEK